jgi:hypothetical protein
MIQANELRIDNLVMWDGDICKTNLLLISVLYEDGLHPNTTPIPLTEEWLVKFGFVGKEDYNSREYPFAHFIFTKITKSNLCEKFKIGCNQNGFHFYSMVYVKYVHQLQNLFFSITEQELELTQ